MLIAIFLSDMFIVNADTGRITTENRTQRGWAGDYTLQVGVTDGGAEPLVGVASVSITVLRGNDQPPEWITPSQPNFVARVPEVGKPKDDMGHS